jgi:tetratricopeptide (TPR) repeat protein
MMRTAMVDPCAVDTRQSPAASPVENGELYPARRHGRISGVRALRLALALGALVATSTAARGAAQGAAAEAPAENAVPSPSVAAAARAHFLSGVEHYRARRYRDAIRELQVSRSLVPNAEIWFNVGRAHEQLGELQLAVDYYRSYLRDRPDAKDAAEVESRIRDLEQRMATARAAAQGQGASREGTIVLEVTPKAARVRLDGVFLEGDTDGRVLQVAPGRRTLDAVLPGYAPHHARLDVEPGGLRAAYLELSPREGRADRSRSRPLVWIAAGLSGGALLSTGVLALAAASERDAGDAPTARGLQRASQVTLVAALGLAVTAAVIEIATSGRDGP